LNVVSAERGAIRKRYGSTVFASGIAAQFPALVVKDSFERANESPLSNGGKWSSISPFARGQISGNAWTVLLPGTFAAARWNVTEQANPAVSLQWSSGNPTAFGVMCCLSASTFSGYEAEFRNSGFAGSPYNVSLIEYVAGVPRQLAEASAVPLKAGDSVGIALRGGVLTAWTKHEETWTKRVEAATSTYTTGYTGISASEAGNFKNFASGEQLAPPTEAEFSSLATVNIAGTPYMIASNGEKIFSITTSGTITEIGSGFTAGTRWSVVQAPKSTGVASQGPVYLVNGVDKPQYWTGATAATAVKEWVGIASQPKLTDGHANKATAILKSATAQFVSGDLGLTLILETEVKAAGNVVKEALIEQVISPTEVQLAINEEGWETEYTNVHFTLERSYYEKGKHVPNGQYMVFFGNRIWMTGIKEDPSAIWFSELVSIGEGGAQADPSAWPASNVVRFDSSDGYNITGIGTVGPYLLTFKESKTWVIHDINTGANRRLSDTVGCIAPRSIVETNGGTFFLTADQGLYLTEGSKLHEMSYNVKPTILGLNPAQREHAAGAYFNNHYYLSFAAGTSNTNNRTLDYDVQLKSWWLHDLTGNQWTIFEPITGEISLYTIPPRAKAGVVKAFVPGIYTDSGANYTGNEILGAWWISNWEPFAYYVFRHRIKAPFLKKRVRAVFFNGSGEIIPIIYRDFTAGGTQEPAVVGAKTQSVPSFPTNFSAGEPVYGNENEEQLFAGELYQGVQMIYGGARSAQAARLYAPGVGFVWSVGFGNNSHEGFEIDSFAYFVQFRKS
jgi:hypothetical protein